MKLSDLGKKLITSILIIAVIFIIGSIIFYRSWEFVPLMLGVILGSTLSITKVFLLERTVDKVLAMEKSNAKNYASLQHILRLLFTGIVLVLGAIIPQISLWGVAVGVLAFQVGIYGVNFFSKR